MRKIPTLLCHRCQHRWVPRTNNPKLCPKCKSSYWRTKRKKNLGNCPHCHELIFDRSTRDIFGRETTTWVHLKDGTYLHRRCWNKIKKATPKTTHIKYESPTLLAPLGNFELKGEI